MKSKRFKFGPQLQKQGAELWSTAKRRRMMKMFSSFIRQLEMSIVFDKIDDPFRSRPPKRLPFVNPLKSPLN